MSLAPVEVRRARPLLGTLVEITAVAPSSSTAMHAIDVSFACIARVHALMSFHDAHSDVARLNRYAYRAPVRVHSWTWQVLCAAHRLSLQTRGAFDITSGGQLARWGYLPRPSWMPIDSRATWRDVQLLPGHRVRFARRLLVDLGGIAKGFAVDRAVERLRAEGACAGLVNAGGDLRAFGDVPRRIHLRHPASPGRFVLGPLLSNGALATSAHYFARRSWRGVAVTPIVDSRRGKACTGAQSVSVAANNCMLADALTKVCMVRGTGMVRRFRAAALVLEPASLGE